MAVNQIKQKQTPEVITKLEYAFSIGASTAEACFYADIGTTTYYRWCDENEALRDRFESLKQKLIFKSREVVVDAINAGDVKIAMWYLERKRKREFSMQFNQNLSGDLRISKIEHTIVDVTDEELLKIATGGSKKIKVLSS